MTAGPVLIIEDEPDIAEVLRYSLEKAGFDTRAVLTGEEGLNASLDRTNPPFINSSRPTLTWHEWDGNLPPAAH